MSLPEVLSDSAWIGGIKDRFLDVEQKHIFGMFYTISTGSINRDVLPDLKIKSFEELLSPALKGKLVSVDRRVVGGGGISTLWPRRVEETFRRSRCAADERQRRSRRTGGPQSAADLADERQSRFAIALQRGGCETEHWRSFCSRARAG